METSTGQGPQGLEGRQKGDQQIANRRGGKEEPARALEIKEKMFPGFSTTPQIK